MLVAAKAASLMQRGVHTTTNCISRLKHGAFISNSPVLRHLRQLVCFKRTKVMQLLTYKADYLDVLSYIMHQFCEQTQRMQITSFMGV